MLNLDSSLTRLQVAQIVHEYLLNELNEEDEPDISNASILKDLYECHACVNHIAQVYLKGIMAPYSERLFGCSQLITNKDIVDITDRINNKMKRIIPVVSKRGVTFCKMEDVKGARIIDVRPLRDFSGEHENIPLSKLVLNPHIISDDKYEELIFICDNGSSALIAANCAYEAGYRNVYYSSYNK